MNRFFTESAWTGKALLIAGAVAIMLVGNEDLGAAPEPTRNVSAQWIQYEAPAMPKTIVRPASSTAEGRQFSAAGQQRWVF